MRRLDEVSGGRGGPSARGPLALIDAADRRLFKAIEGLGLPRVDRVMRALTSAADFSKLWIALAAALGASGRGAGRRAALRGLTSLAATSAVVNLLVKPLTGRRRPDRDTHGVMRVARRIPRSSSFPSGHSASAAAFACGVAIEAPALAPPLAALAATVAYSRVHTGVHYPGDALVGFAIGAAVAAGGARLAPPRRATASGTAGTSPSPAPALPDGEGLVCLVNPSAGNGTGSEASRAIRRELPRAEIHELAEGEDAAGVLRRLAQDARALAVAGGDGSVRIAAEVALERDLPLLVLPAGTFDHFAGALGIQSVDDAIALLARGEAVRVDVGELDERVFLNTAALGSHPAYVRTRERWQGRVGRPAATAIAVGRVLLKEPSIKVRIDGREHRVALVFVGNCRYDPRGIEPARRERLDDGVLDLRVLEAGHRLGTLRLAASLASGRLARSHIYIERSASELVLELPPDGADVTLDGELERLAGEVRIAKRRATLTAYAPAAQRRSA